MGMRSEGGKELSAQDEAYALGTFRRDLPAPSVCALAPVRLARPGWLFPGVLSDRRTLRPLHTSSTS
ncbi:hypothetical protein PAMP_017884 [Pampus punctatissimus]